jgi:cytochrome c biogenesis protein CcdA
MSIWMAIGSALWLGILTSISPCPLATNIAAISFLGRQVSSSRRVILSGLIYTLGRTAAYVLLAALLLSGMAASDALSRFLQRYLNILLGPLLILVGLVLLQMLGGTLSLNLAGSGIQSRAAKGGVFWTLALGFLFAISFCPASAGLYFGAFLPLAAAQNSTLLLPTLYGIGTALPVMLFSVLIAFGGQYVGAAFENLTHVERWLRIATGVIFIVAGVYLSLTFVYGMPSLSR